MGACGFLAASHTVAHPSAALASRNAFRENVGGRAQSVQRRLGRHAATESSLLFR